mmetsp:Transcript_101554/g.201717  ORF Transcript_101554/g.201717 Transcript_101554/m.201717 type:complete len:146 (-) Transcript_101554:446-883(-)
MDRHSSLLPCGSVTTAGMSGSGVRSKWRKHSKPPGTTRVGHRNRPSSQAGFGSKFELCDVRFCLDRVVRDCFEGTSAAEGNVNNEREAGFPTYNACEEWTSLRVAAIEAKKKRTTAPIASDKHAHQWMPSRLCAMCVTVCTDVAS